MARQKQAIPLQRTPSDFQHGPPESPDHGWKAANGHASKSSPTQSNGSIKGADAPAKSEQAGLTQLIICVGGIYASFLSWAILQERITTTPYGSSSSPERFTYSIFLNTIQSFFAALTGYIYLHVSTSHSSGPTPSIFPSRSILFPLILVAITSSLASPFGYASLSHIDYITFILAKSCKLLPVMFLHLTIFRKSYPLYKYLVVFLVTAGVAVFTLHHPSPTKKPSASNQQARNTSSWGLLLLGINLLFDGLTNSTQDHIFSTFRPYSGPQMMVAQNVLSTLLTTAYLFLSPLLAHTPLFTFLNLTPSSTNTNEITSALAFLHRHPSVSYDVLGFATCGAIGQIFIYYTLSHFSSLLLVTVTVTRKMLTMMLSVVWFGHRLSGMQWLGVGLVFGGVGAEGWIQRREKAAREKEKEKEKEKRGRVLGGGAEEKKAL
ncbi:UDP-galactose transporter [Lignoscripta atroalba]|nr:UDP-galactose transporter [Lignoscripta atroalba]